MPQAIHIDGLLGNEPMRHFDVEPGESLKQVFDRLGVSARFEEVPAKSWKASPEVERFIANYKPEDPDSVLAVFSRYHSLEAEEFDTVEEAERFLDGGEEYGSLAGEAVVVGDEIQVRD
jgi:hypothetical protein